MPLLKIIPGAAGAAARAEWSTRPSGNVQTGVDGVSVSRLTDLTGQGRHAAQSTEASQPEIDASTADGALMVEFAGAEHLTADLGSAAVRTLIAVIDVPTSMAEARPIFSRDTTETTTKAALELSLT